MVAILVRLLGFFVFAEFSSFYVNALFCVGISRLNRCHPKKQDTFVLDFANDPELIKMAFQSIIRRRYCLVNRMSIS